ncbi:alpha/beta fold hydrolase [Flavobacteriaceae bacterium AU392]|nr:alpha/beta fold hydrolase [Flavobacteriaceae bacterium]RKM84827.1 alpha/beta fold hydrolase [Flavobacteriaceae bacterium AU392]
MLRPKIVLLILFFTSIVNAQFSKCSDQNEFDELKLSLCATVKTPLYHQSDKNETIDLFVRKFPSLKDRKGSLWLIPGGPGESGASMYALIEKFSKQFPHLDIFVPDHRGTGLSAKICPNEEDVNSKGSIALVNEEWGSCFEQMYSNQEYVQAFSITNGAKDLSKLINDLSGKGKRYVYGVSYGTQLVLRLLQLNSTKIDGIILDSLIPLQDDVDYDLSQRSFVINDVGLSVIESLNKLEPNSATSLTSQLQSIIKRTHKDTIFSKKLPRQELSIIFGMMLDLPKVRNKIPEIIKELSKENIEPLNNAIAEITEFYTSYSKYKTSSNSIPLVQIITASENNLRPEIKKSDVALESKDLLFKSPLPSLMAENRMPTYKKDVFFGKAPKNMPPTLIINGTLDPKTHYEGAVRHFKKLSENSKEIVFMSVEDAPHFIALFASDSFFSIASKFINGEKLTNKLIVDKNTALK